mmetsp:Transcript_34008/g.84763  ORF Transcript_34008/g.84763 Transcript_34008/m.84763 type:complete len:89 (+) Transcript_34008:157-423(+)
MVKGSGEGEDHELSEQGWEVWWGGGGANRREARVASWCETRRGATHEAGGARRESGEGEKFEVTDRQVELVLEGGLRNSDAIGKESWG